MTKKKQEFNPITLPNEVMRDIRDGRRGGLSVFELAVKHDLSTGEVLKILQAGNSYGSTSRGTRL